MRKKTMSDHPEGCCCSACEDADDLDAPPEQPTCFCKVHNAAGLPPKELYARCSLATPCHEAAAYLRSDEALPNDLATVTARATWEDMKPYLDKMLSADNMQDRVAARLTAYALFLLGFKRLQAKLSA